MWGQLIAEASGKLETSGVASPLHDAHELAEYVLGKRPDLGSEVSEKAHHAFTGLVLRRARREPLQHIIGTMWFRYLTLDAKPGVFIVRPETEMVTQAGIDAIRAIAKPVVVDLCTGSGAIALAIATEVPGARVYAVEKSPVAYAAAQKNNARYGSPVILHQGDAREVFSELNGRVDLVISNPPYVPKDHELSEEVLADPHEALFGGGEDGLALPRQLITRATELLRPGGILIMEHADEQGAAMRQAAVGFSGVITGQDLASRDRWLQARWDG